MLKLQEESFRLEEARIANYEKLTSASQQVVAAERALLEVKRLQLERETQLRALAEATATKTGAASQEIKNASSTKTAIEAKVTEGTASDKDLERLAAINEMTAKNNKLIEDETQKYLAVAALLEEIFGIKFKIAEITATEAMHQGKLNDLIKFQEERMQSLKDISESLSNVFGDVGQR